MNLSRADVERIVREEVNKMIRHGTLITKQHVDKQLSWSSNSQDDLEERLEAVERKARFVDYKLEGLHEMSAVIDGLRRIVKALVESKPNREFE